MGAELKIGITMRRSDACSYKEIRYGLAHEWVPFLASVLPEAAWILLPNIGKDIVQTVNAFGVNGVILSGGDDIGTDPLRDETESALLQHCLDNQYPLFGVCRGLQFLQHAMGGMLTQCSRERHVAQRHCISCLETPYSSGGDQEVNSYHGYGIAPEDLACGLSPVATDEDGMIEACYVNGRPAVAVMWHPERESVPREFDLRIVRTLFGFAS